MQFKKGSAAILAASSAPTRTALEGLSVEAPQKLFAALAAAPELGTIEFRVSAKRQKKKIKGSTVQVARRARMVRPRLRAMKITPRAPFRRGGKLPAVSFWALLAEEFAAA